MITIINSQQCYTSPTTMWTIQYEYKRNGADMYYRFNWKVWMYYSNGFYDYGIDLQFFLDGVQNSVTVKGVNVNEFGWSKSSTTDWYKVANKTTGTTQFYCRLYDTTRAKVMNTSSAYNLTVAGAGSVLGAIGEFDVDNGVTVAITKYDTSFTDTLVVSYGNTTLKTISGITNGTVVSFADILSTIYSLMSTVASGTFTFALTTKSGSTTIGTSTQTATGKITNAHPTFTADQVTYADTNTAVTAVTGNPLHIVQNKSSLAVTITSAATGNKGARIEEYYVIVNGEIKAGNDIGTFEFGAINSAQDVTLIVWAIDSRMNITIAEKTITVFPWSVPVVSAELERLNNYEDETYLTVKASISSVNNKNDMTVTYKKKPSGGEYGSDTTISNNTKHTMSCDKDYAWVVSVTVTDKFGSTTKEFPLAKGKFPLFIDTEKNAVGINEFPAEGEALRVAGGVAFFEDGIVLTAGSKKYKLTVNDGGSLVIEEYEGVNKND